MELEPLLALLQQLARQHQGDEAITILTECWQPFPCAPGETPTPAQLRRIYLLNTLPLGRGTFGIVFAALMVVGTQDGVDLYAPVALKMAPVLRDHINETVNGMAVNELIWSGCTPGLARTMDAFCINGSLDMCKMPPESWKDLWAAYDLFVYSKGDDIRRHYGKDSMHSINNVTQTARLSSGCTVGFMLTELSPYNLTTSVEQVPTQPRPSIVGTIDTDTLLQYIYVKIQSVAALHMANLMHLDIHNGNWIESMPISERCNGFTLPLSTEASQADRASIYGNYAQSPQIRDMCYGFLQRPLPTAAAPYKVAADVRDNAVKIGTHKIPLLIDFGAMRNAQVSYEMSAFEIREFVRHTYFAKRPDIKSDELPRFGFSHTPMQHNRGASSPYGLPLMIALQSPSTNILTRSPEQMNPFIINRPHPTKPEREEFLGVGISSELSDVFSLMTVVVSDLIGFNPFSQQIPICTVPTVTGTSNDDPKHPQLYRIGVEVHPNNIKRYRTNATYKLSSVFGSVYVECSHETNRSSAGNYDLRRSANNQPKKEYDPENHQPNKVHDFYSDDSHVKMASLVNPKTDLPQNGEVHATSLYEHVETFIRKTAPKVHNYTRWVGYADDKFDEAELAWTVRGVVARIEALGIPNAEECLGTFFYPLFRQLEKIYTPNATGDGWLYDVLHRAITHRLGITGPEGTDFFWLCRDALAWEPARRPPAHRILESPLFSRLYAPQSSINTDPRRFWSAAMPIPTFWPQVHDESLLNLRIKKRPATLQEVNAMIGEDTSGYFTTPRIERHFLYDSIFTSLNAVKYRTFVNNVGRLPGFMTANHRSNFMPMLHPDESQEIAVCNLNTGLLDYHNGAVCMNYTEGVIVMVHAEGLVGHFNNRENVGFYCTSLVGSAKRNNCLVPDWIFCSEEEFQALPSVPLTERRQRMRTKFRESGRSIDELLPDFPTLEKQLELYTQQHSIPQSIPPESGSIITLAHHSLLPRREEGEIVDLGVRSDNNNNNNNNKTSNGKKRPHDEEVSHLRNVKPRVDSYRPDTRTQPFASRDRSRPPPPRKGNDRFRPSSHTSRFGQGDRGGNRGLH